ncbi:hypothetical protein SBA3_2910026 [Candidatus Sulfopaludibacter sp. SbA3]|nr:hypothetical protein SBA3_2910026 [Candidatus Sulfopaludibacter sp. SbA3]
MKPDLAVIVKLYVPGSTPFNIKIPSAPDVALRVVPALGSLITMVASGTAAPAGSITVPCKMPVVDWLKTQPHMKAKAPMKCAIRLIFIVPSLPAPV